MSKNSTKISTLRNVVLTHSIDKNKNQGDKSEESNVNNYEQKRVNCL